ncbi:hypothetical protein CGLO_10140 [Colletotrichum gloeosporioides Cg-14]|uniref:Uncharacterized protein n=1 Tax=Colletotrichum gloeosporioides (strain Cg-14) TaxID=1237896 RepID=T0LQE8_COLGC|nr:hypothetical protein CGLO_10140 [Colletotrichum gloeosporioides Cg-14]
MKVTGNIIALVRAFWL